MRDYTGDFAQNAHTELFTFTGKAPLAAERLTGRTTKYFCKSQIFPYLCNSVKNFLDKFSCINRHSGLNECLFSFSHLPRGGTESRRLVVLHLSNYLTQMRTHRPKLAHITIRVVVEKLVKVRAYKRIRKGKVERVRSHYRRY